MDVQTVINTHPELAIVDELAHTNIPGSKNEKRWQDVLEILDAGINVISAVNIQHIESLYDEVRAITGVDVTERVPDAAKAVIEPTSATPIIRAEAVAAVRRGLRTAFSRASSPRTPTARGSSAPRTRITGRASTGASVATPSNEPSAPSMTGGT